MHSVNIEEKASQKGQLDKTTFYCLLSKLQQKGLSHIPLGGCCRSSLHCALIQQKIAKYPRLES